ncbi:MAG: nitroreductase family protein [Bacteroidota bacterium]
MKTTIRFVAIFCFCIINLQAIYSQAEQYPNETIKTIHNRKSVRHFTGDAVSKEQVEILLKAAMAAPSAVNKQPWAFMVINKRDRLDSLAVGLPYTKMLMKAGAAIIVCGDLSKALEGKSAELWKMDCMAASENILLAAESLGLGAVFTAVYPDDDKINFVSKFFKLPKNIIPLCVIPIGKPTGEDKPKDKYKSDNIHWDSW